MINQKTLETSNLQSDTSFYHKPQISKNTLAIQKKLLTISITCEFIIRNINFVQVRNSAVDDLYYLLQDLSLLIQGSEELDF